MWRTELSALHQSEPGPEPASAAHFLYDLDPFYLVFVQWVFALVFYLSVLYLSPTSQHLLSWFVLKLKQWTKACSI
jgi:hypothetical protein